MNKPDVKKLVLLNLPYVFAFYFADKIAAVFRLAPGTEFIDKLTNGFAVFGTTFANPLPSFHPVDLLIGLIAGALLKLAVYVKGKNRKKFRQGEEYGSARWGKPEDIKPYMDPAPLRSSAFPRCWWSKTALSPTKLWAPCPKSRFWLCCKHLRGVPKRRNTAFCQPTPSTPAPSKRTRKESNPTGKLEFVVQNRELPCPVSSGGRC